MGKPPSAVGLSLADDTAMDVDSFVDEVEVNSHESDADDEAKPDILMNDFAKHSLAFLKLKIMEDNTLPVAAATCVLEYMQMCFNTYQQQFVGMVCECLQLMDFDYNADTAMLRQLLCENSVFVRCQNKFETEYLFSKYLEENMNCAKLHEI